MLILEKRNGMLELVRFDPRKMEPAGMPIPLWKGRGTDAEFDQIGPFVHIKAVGRRPFRLKGEGVVITRYGEVYRDIAKIEGHLPDGLLITKNAKGGNTSIIRTKTGKGGEQAGTEMYYVDGKYKVYYNGVTGEWEILAKAKEARGSRLRWFGGVYTKSRISRWFYLPDKAGLYDISDDANFYQRHSRWRPETKELELSESMAKELGINRQPLAASYNPAWDLFVVEIPGPEKRRAIVDISGRKVFWMQSSLVAENIIYYDIEKGEIGIDYDSRLHVVSDGGETDYGVFKYNYLYGGNATYYVPGRCVSVSIDAGSLRPEANAAEIDDRAAEGYRLVAFDNGYLVFIKSGTTEFKYLKIPEAARAAGPAPAETAPALSDEEQMERIDTLLKSNGLSRAGRLIGSSNKGRPWILDLSDTAVSDISLLEGCTNIEDLCLSGTNIEDLTPIRGLKNLKYLRLKRTRVGDLTPLADLTGLIELNIGSTRVMDLTPLANLKELISLNINSTRVRDLTPLFGLPKLTSVYARGLRVEHKDVYELFRGLFRNNAPNLERLVVHLRFDIQIDISKVPREYVTLPAQPSAAAGNRSGTENLSDDEQAAKIIPLLKRFGLSDEEQTAKVIALLKQLGLDPHDTTIFSKVSSYAWRLDLKGTGIKDLSPLEGVNNLRYLILDDTPVEDLRPISGMSNLSVLSIRRTGVKYLKPVGNLTDLVSLSLEGCNRITDFTPLRGMNSLEYLNLSKTRVKDLTPLSGLSMLSHLFIDNTPVRDLAPLAGLKHLEALHVNGTNVQDLRPLYGLPLKYLSIDYRITADEDVLYRFLYVMHTEVTTFDPATGAINKMSSPVARPQEPGKEAAPEAEPTAEDESVIPKEAAAAAGPSAALSAKDELEEAWRRTFLRSEDGPALRERILDGFRASWESGLFDIIPERYRASVSAALSPVLSRLYDNETKFVNRIFLENRETTEDIYEAEDMPFARFISRIAALKSGLRAFLASPQAAVMMQDYETGKKYLTNIAASLFELAAEEHEHAIPEPDGVFYHMLGLGWSVAQEWQRPAASF
jgi:Leucine-rich repeat (LRR) protein